MVVTVARPRGPGQRLSVQPLMAVRVRGRGALTRSGHVVRRPDQGKWWPAARASPYHSGRVSGRSEPSAAARTRAGGVVPSTTCIGAGCGVIHAVAIASGDTP